MNKSQPRTEETLRSELLALGAREYEVAALTMVPQRGLSALRFAQMKGAERPIAYAIAIFDDPDWHPSGEKPRQGVNLHAEAGPSQLPSPRPEENLEQARKILERLRAG
jgi:hypothetical protein